MKNNQMTCDPERIELFLRQQLSNEEQTAFELHLDDCNDCRCRLEATAAGDDIWSGVRDALLCGQLPPDSLRSGDSALDSATSDDVSFSHDTVLKLLAPTDDAESDVVIMPILSIGRGKRDFDFDLLVDSDDHASLRLQTTRSRFR